MAEYVKVMKDYSKMCKTYLSKGKCSECPLYSENNRKFLDCGEFTEKYPKEAEQIIENWTDKNPVMTNSEKAKEIFGHSLDFTCFANFNYICKCDRECKKCLYYADAEYHAPEGSEKE